MSKYKTSLTQQQQKNLQITQLSRLVISIMTIKKGYNRGMTPLELQKKLFTSIPKELGKYLEDKEIMKSVVRHLRRFYGYPILCTRGPDNKGTWKYYIADENGLDVYNQMLGSIEKGIRIEKKEMEMRANGTWQGPHKNHIQSKRYKLQQLE